VCLKLNGLSIVLGCLIPFRLRMVMAVGLKLSGVCIAIGCRTPPRWRMVMAVYLNRLAYALQLDAEHLRGGEWSWLYISMERRMHCNWVQKTLTEEYDQCSMSQAMGVCIASGCRTQVQWTR